MTSVERIVEYVSVPSEQEKIEDDDASRKKLGLRYKPLKEWPPHGQITFENVAFSYDRNLPDTLKELNFTIRAGEKIGIVGRTGAGKSTIIQALFRMAEPTGSIIIDQVNIKDIGLSDLRSKISIIPVIN